jgi:hypothetical protein
MVGEMDAALGQVGPELGERFLDAGWVLDEEFCIREFLA